jgi:hypothetical protein
MMVMSGMWGVQFQVFCLLHRNHTWELGMDVFDDLKFPLMTQRLTVLLVWDIRCPARFTPE